MRKMALLGTFLQNLQNFSKKFFKYIFIYVYICVYIIYKIFNNNR